MAGEVMPPVRIAAKAKGQQMLPHIAQKSSQRVSLTLIRLEYQ